MQISFLNPGNRTDPFYGRMARFMLLAADSIGIDLEILDCDRDPLLLEENASRLLSRVPAPEYLLMVNDQGVAEDLLPRANAKNTKVLLINQELLSVEKSVLGDPRGRLPSWLGELLPDDHQAGYLLAQNLVAEARKRRLADRDGRIQLLGLGGAYTISSLLRINGLRNAVKDHSDVALHSVAPALWDQTRAREIVAAALRESPDIAVVWAASDVMGMGALQAIEEVGRTAGEDVLVGGIDWAPSVLPKIREGALTASVGGHFMDGAWATVMLYDHSRGLDFAANRATTRFAVLSRETLDTFSCFFDETHWRNLDFTRFSKAHNRGMQHYDFSIDTIFGQPQGGGRPPSHPIHESLWTLPVGEKTVGRSQLATPIGRGQSPVT